MPSPFSVAPKPAAKTGRPMSFDKTAALQRAMHLFWEHGYEATSMADLTAAMQITAPSLYNAYGSKEQLFIAALDLYMAGIGAAGAALLAQAPTAREGVRRLLEQTAEEQARRSHPPGCMLVAAASNGSAAPPTVRRHVAYYHQLAQAGLRERIERGVREGDVAPAEDVAALAAFYMATIDDMATLARNGTPLPRLLAICALAMRAWPPA